MESNLLRLVEEKWKAACSLVKPIFQHEFNLSMHFQVIRAVFLMEAGDLMNQFYASLFEQVTSLASKCEFCADVCLYGCSKYEECSVSNI
jgi:hypothetical protein